jgi:flagellar biosynthetic protein FliR
MRVRLAIAISFTLLIFPAVDVQKLVAPSLLFLSVSEAMAGIFFGILLRFFVFALQIAGSIAAQSTSLSQIFGGSAGVDPQPAMGHVLVVAGLALASLMGLHVQFAAYILSTYQMVPVGSLIGAGEVMRMGLAQVSACFSLGFSLSAPFVIASLLYNITLGVINRAMPQLMVSFVGAPAITAGGLLILMMAAPIMLVVWYENFVSFVAMPGGR